MLPERYRFLEKEPGPKMLVEALKLYGVKEKAGNADNPEILAWADEVGLRETYQHDSIPWCGLFMAVVAKRAGKPLPAGPLWARAWAHWGSLCPAELGAVLVFVRDGGGHVGLYVGEDSQHFHVLGGNQSDSVCVTRIAKDRLLAARCMYRVRPANIRQVRILGAGNVSSNER